MKTSKYTHFEVEKTRKAEGDDWEVVIDGSHTYFSVYGRNQKGLAEWLGDFKDETSATHLCDTLNSSLTDVNKQIKDQNEIIERLTSVANRLINLNRRLNKSNQAMNSIHTEYNTEIVKMRSIIINKMFNHEN